MAGLVGLVAFVGVVKLLFLVRDALPDESLDLGPGQAQLPPSRDSSRRFAIPDSLRGRSGTLRFTALTAAEAAALPGMAGSWGDSVIRAAGLVTVPSPPDTFALMVMRPFAAKRGDSIGGYRLGRWPAERWMMASNYLNPDGFIEVTPSIAGLRLSEHFQLGDFLTHDQLDTWPKYLILEERLIDKLELVLAEMAQRGVDARHVVVLSGFRAPYYNDLAIDEGAARASRHQYGDAADILIDADGDGRMDDLNGDGRRDLRDARVISQAVAAVEHRFPELVGGLGTYAAMGPRGPFAHVDVRGTSARWER
jgi:hypothetical protein